jgi:hypothetical protein
MLLKTLNITLGVLVAFSVWCAALMFAVFAAILTLHVLAIGGLMIWHLMHS